MPLSSVDKLGIAARDKTNFVLKSRRIDYTFEFFRQTARNRDENPDEFQTVKDQADESFIWTLKFNTLRLISVSTLLGFNVAFFSYYLALRFLKPYVGIPLALGTFLVTRNILCRNSLERIYYPMEPVYQEIRKHRTITS